MSELVAVDPGMNCAGLALFRDGQLVGAVSITVPDDVGHELKRVSLMAQRIVFEARVILPEAQRLAFEWPQVYDARAGKSKGNPNNLLPLAALGGALAPMFREVEMFTPREWKGQVGKPRSKKDPYIITDRVLDRLTDDEAESVRTVPMGAWDTWDAIGIGLHALGRFKRKRVFPGATH